MERTHAGWKTKNNISGPDFETLITKVEDHLLRRHSLGRLDSEADFIAGALSVLSYLRSVKQPPGAWYFTASGEMTTLSEEAGPVTEDTTNEPAIATTA